MNEVATFSNRPRRGVAEAMTEGLGGGLPPHISIKGNRFALVDGGGTRYPVAGTTGTSLYGVIVDANPKASRLYYEGVYEDGADTPPTCFSDNGVAPSRDAQEKQGRTCAECPMSAWGSAQSRLTGKGVPACREYRKVALLVLDQSGRPEPMPYMLSLPPNSLKALRTYGQMIGSQPAPGTDRKLDVSDVITQFSFADGTMGTLEMKNVAYVTQAPGVIEAIDAVWDSGVTDAMVGKNDIPWEGPAALPTREPQPRLPQSVQPALPHQQPAAASVPPQRAVSKDPNLAAPYGGEQVQQPDKPKPGRGGARPGAGRPKQVEPAQQLPAARAAAPAANGGDNLDIPGFLRREKPVEQDGRPAFMQARPAQQGQFGLAAGNEPSAELEAAIEDAFKLPT